MILPLSVSQYVSISVGKPVFSKTTHRVFLKLLIKLGALKVVPATLLLVWFLSLNKRTCQTRKNVFYFTSKALFSRKFNFRILHFNFHDVIKCLSIKQMHFTE